LAITTESLTAHDLYNRLLVHEPSEAALADSARFLEDQLDAVSAEACNMPDNPAQLTAWLDRHYADVGEQFAAYRAARRAGAPREYFSTRSHALYFLRGVAPTKLVDGAWLYGLTRRWHDDRYYGLIKTYLEELGDGKPEDNHVAMYRQLLAEHGCEQITGLQDAHYMQGAIQLALAYNAHRFLPEVIGFNLGYEQLPLHLLITAYELDELGIDPYYFTVHVTIDNAGTGHARRALDSVTSTLPVVGNAGDFYARMRRGFQLNDLGMGTVDVIRSFDLEAELIRILRAKSVHGRHAHADYCRVGGRTVNEWLTQPQDIGLFLQKLEEAGWIRRHADPRQSRFWRLVHGERAEMFGVFSPYELQVMHDWIAGDVVQQFSAYDGDASGAGRATALAGARAMPRGRRYRSRLAGASDAGAFDTAAAQPRDENGDDFDAELRLLRHNVARAGSKEDAMELLADMIGPATHHTPAGLMATRMYTRMLQQRAGWPVA